MPKCGIEDVTRGTQVEMALKPLKLPTQFYTPYLYLFRRPRGSGTLETR